jgi:rhodanese-related sulfurtransferase
MIESNPSLVILDVRSQAEYDSGHLQNATLIPVTDLARRLYELDKQKDILVYCGSGGRSATASQTLVDNGFSSVYNMLGGITSWKNAGYWIEIVHNGDLVIGQTQTFVIENCTYIQSGNIDVRDYGTFIIRNAELFLSQSSYYEYEVTVEDNGNWSSSNAILSSNYYFSQRFDDNSTVNFTKTHWANFTWIYGSGGFLSFCESDNSLGDISVSSQMLFVNSNVSFLLGGADSYVRIENSTMLYAGIGAQYSELYVDNLSAGPISTFSTFDNLTVVGGSVASIDVLNSDMSFGFIDLFGANLTANNSSIWGIEAHGSSKVVVTNSNGTKYSGFSLHLQDNSQAWIHDSFVDFVVSSGNSSFNLYNCTVTNGINCARGHDLGSCFDSRIGYIDTESFTGTIMMNNCAMLGNPEGAVYLSVLDSEFHFSGSVSFPNGSFIGDWNNSAVARDFEIVVTNRTRHPAEDVELALLTQNNTVVWEGFTNSLGRANFNLTFADSNYTDTLRLEAVKGTFSAVENITFFSNTPVIFELSTPVAGDINGDGVVDMKDVSYVARRFMCLPSDPLWDSIADLNSDGKIDMKDISTIAKHFGEHYP